jgi:hypothetical protein
LTVLSEDITVDGPSNPAKPTKQLDSRKRKVLAIDTDESSPLTDFESPFKSSNAKAGSLETPTAVRKSTRSNMGQGGRVEQQARISDLIEHKKRTRLLVDHTAVDFILAPKAQQKNDVSF